MKASANRVRPRLESLEGRAVPAVYTYNGYLYVMGGPGAENATVDRVVTGGVTYLRVTDNGHVTTVRESLVTKPILFLGGAGNDTFTNNTSHVMMAYGGAGNDVINGGSGDDYVEGNDGNDRLYGNGGNDLIFGNAGNDLVVGGAGNDRLVGGAGQDELWGQDGNDDLWGQEGKDFLLGGNGDDYLDGGADGAVAWGGTGADTFISLQTGTNADHTPIVGLFNTNLNGTLGVRDFYQPEGDRKDTISG